MNRTRGEENGPKPKRTRHNRPDPPYGRARGTPVAQERV